MLSIFDVTVHDIFPLLSNRQRVRSLLRRSLSCNLVRSSVFVVILVMIFSTMPIVPLYIERP